MTRIVRAASVALLFVLLVSNSVAASELRYLGADGMTIHDLVTSLRVARENRAASASLRVKPQIVGVDWTKEAFIIPVVVTLQGSNANHFKSDVTIANRRSVAQTVSVGFVQRGINN